MSLPTGSMWTGARLLVLLVTVICTRPLSAATVPEPAWLDVTLNGQEEGVSLVVRDGDRLWIPVAALRDWGVRTDGLAVRHQQGQDCVLLDAAAGLDAHVDERRQSLRLSIPTGRLARTDVRLARPGLGAVAQSDWGGFLNYDLSVERIARETSAEVTLGGRVFSPSGAGTATFAGGAPAHGRVVMKRLDTNWTVDDPDRAVSLVLGDSITRGGIGGGPARFGGIQFGRSFDEQPGFVTLPGVTLGGQAALPSVIDLYVNNVLTAHKSIGSGPFEISDLPVVSGSGDVQLVVRDMMGQQTVVRQSYYTASSLLKGGLDDYSLEFGALRDNYGVRNLDYGPLFVSGSWRHGLSGRLTVEGHAEASRRVWQGGLGLNVAAARLGLLSVALAGSRGPEGTGTLATVGFERRALYFSMGASATFQSAGYDSVGSLDALFKPRRSVQAFMGFPLPVGSLGLTYTLRRYRGLAGVQIAGASAMVRLGHVGTLNLSASRMLGAARDSMVQLTLSTALGRKSHASASASVASDNGRLSATTLYQRNLPAGEGVGYSLATRTGEQDRVDGQFFVRTATGTYGADVAWHDGQVGTRLTASGAIGTIGGSLFAARRVNRSLAMVQVGDFAGVRVYDDNQLIGRTNRNGVLIDTNLRDFDRNTLRIETADLPFDAEMAKDRLTVRPGRRTGVTARFDVRRLRDAVILVQLADGRPVPSGASVETRDGAAAVSAADGEIYLPDLQESNRLTIRWPEGACTVSFPAPTDAGTQPRIGPLTCRAMP